MNETSFFGQQPALPLDRRTMLKRAAAGFGYLAFAGLSAEAASTPAAQTPSATAAMAAWRRIRGVMIGSWAC